MKTFKKKQVIVEAIQFNGNTNKQEIEKFVGRELQAELESETAYVAGVAPPIFSLLIETKEGVMKAFKGDWIIKEPLPTGDRDFYPCKPDIFEKTYDVFSLMKTFEPKSVEFIKAVERDKFFYSLNPHIYSNGANNVIKNYYAPLLSAYTTLQTELKTAQTDMGLLNIAYGQKISQLEVCEKVLADTQTELAQVRKERDSANYKLEMLELMINELPQNRPLYCDSGAWTVRSEDLETIYFNQDINETFYQFITRVFEADNMLKHLSEPAAPDNLK